jgi:hypothetical protein
MPAKDLHNLTNEIQRLRNQIIVLEYKKQKSKDAISILSTKKLQLEVL